MGDIRVDGKLGPKIESVDEMVGRFSGELNVRVPQWTTRAMEHPEEMEALEREIHAVFSAGADLLIAGLLALVLGSAEFARTTEATRKGHSQQLGRGRSRTIKVRLLGGLIIWVTTLYCAPRKRMFRKSEEPGSGVYVELVQLGVHKGVSPGLQSRVARKVALCPSLKIAHQELRREGVAIDPKSVRRIAYQCGQQMLGARKDLIDRWREGELPAGSELAGCRVSVQIDGGRIKLREKLDESGNNAKNAANTENCNEDGLPCDEAPGRWKPQPKRNYKTAWREPKLMTIFVHDDHGKMVRKSQVTIDGTLLGPDSICELAAMHLHRLGAAQALSVTFIADGAPWIWDRIGRIVELSQLKDVAIYQVLDNCHAAHHVSLALAAKGFIDKDRIALYRMYRSLLRDGHWQRVIEELTDYGEIDLSVDKNAALRTEIEYLRKHGEAGRLNYPKFAQLGIPLGSGAIESTVRRVLNMRLKSNAMFWREENAEAMMAVRASVISDRWDEWRSDIKSRTLQVTLNKWQWAPLPMSSKKIEPDQATAT